MAPLSAFSPEQQAELDRRFDTVNASTVANTNAIEHLNAALAELMEEVRLLSIRLDPQQTLPIAQLSALSPSAQPSAPPAPKLPPQPIPTPVPARSYPPAPSVEALDEVELKQVYKPPLRNIRKQPMRQKHRAAKAMPKTPRDAETFDAEVFGNCIAWPPKFGGTNMRLSRDQYLDAWYTTMLNTHAKELATQALPFPA